MLARKVHAAVKLYLYQLPLVRNLCLSNDHQETVKRSVYISQSNDIFSNLALEDWIYKNVDCRTHHILMLWSNNPCVVIGRFQNPWLEANIAELDRITDRGVHLARRNSGGGTVYHDRGNLNLTFFTSRDKYDRKINLKFLQQVLRKEYGTEVEISKREDLMIRDYKISGTASKLGRLSSYHHCTLLVSANKTNLSLALKKQESEIKTNATQSVKSKIINLQDENPNITVENLLEAIGRYYLQKGVDLSCKRNNLVKINNNTYFEYVNPSEENFPGLNQLREDLASWEWKFGKTPKFTISRRFNIPRSFLPDIDPSNKEEEDLTVSLIVDNGIIQDITLGFPVSVFYAGFESSLDVATNLKGQKFTSDSLNRLTTSLGTEFIEENVKNMFVVDCLKKVVLNQN